MASFENLKNRYFCMRHGRSEANEAGLIVSDPQKGCHGWGLASGAEEAVKENWEASGLDSSVIILSSPFRRTFETALLVAGWAGCGEPETAEELRERWFGNWEGTDHGNYPRIWEFDRVDAGNERDGVESPRAVLARLESLLYKCEARWSGKKILLVSHGDPMDILITAAGGHSLEKHMDTGMKTAEIRALGSGSASSGAM